MNNLRRCVIPTLRNGSKALSQRSTMAATLSSSALVVRQARGPTEASFYHTSTMLSNAADKPTEAFLTEEMISAMEYHHEQRDVTDLNLFLKHPSSPKMMAWHPDLIFDGDNYETISKHEMDETVQAASPAVNDDEDTSSVVSAPPATRRRGKMSFLNRNARYGNKASKGKRPVSRQARRRKKRAIGNHRR